MLAAFRQRQASPSDAAKPVNTLLVGVPVGLVGLIIMLAVSRSFLLGRADFAIRNDWRLQLRDELTRMHRDPSYLGDQRTMSITFPGELDLPRNELPFLEEHHLSLFAESKPKGR